MGSSFDAIGVDRSAREQRCHVPASWFGQRLRPGPRELAGAGKFVALRIEVCWQIAE
jgi:hypothetical protein